MGAVEFRRMISDKLHDKTRDIGSPVIVEDDETSLDKLEYPYNQEFSHPIEWAPLEYHIQQERQLDTIPVPHHSPQDDDFNNEYPYNQDVMESGNYTKYETWKEGTSQKEEPEDLDMMMEYPYNQLFGRNLESSRRELENEDETKSGPLLRPSRDIANSTENNKLQHTVHTYIHTPQSDTNQSDAIPLNIDHQTTFHHSLQSNHLYRPSQPFYHNTPVDEPSFQDNGHHPPQTLPRPVYLSPHNTPPAFNHYFPHQHSRQSSYLIKDHSVPLREVLHIENQHNQVLGERHMNSELNALKTKGHNIRLPEDQLERVDLALKELPEQVKPLRTRSGDGEESRYGESREGLAKQAEEGLEYEQVEDDMTPRPLNHLSPQIGQFRVHS
jgi:hypothetical protein